MECAGDVPCVKCGGVMWNDVEFCVKWSGEMWCAVWSCDARCAMRLWCVMS